MTRRYEDQETWKGGWTLNRRGRLTLKAGGRVKKLLGIFASPVQPKLEDYYEPWTYDYENLVNAPLGDDFPVARPKSLITGEDTKIRWSANWDDNLGGTTEMGHLDPIVEQVRRESEEKIKFAFEQTFMFYLPRICEHCLNPSCMASCPSGAIYKRAEDGIRSLEGVAPLGDRTDRPAPRLVNPLAPLGNLTTIAAVFMTLWRQLAAPEAVVVAGVGRGLVAACADALGWPGGRGATLGGGPGGGAPADPPGGFARAELRARVLAYLRGLLGQSERRNGWTLAEAAGEVCPGRDAAAAADHGLERRRGPRRA
jgi:ferredoxin